MQQSKLCVYKYLNSFMPCGHKMSYILKQKSAGLFNLYYFLSASGIEGLKEP